MKARDIMTGDPQVVTPDDTLSRAAEIMRDVDVGIVPVVEDRSSMKLRGVITDRDIAVRHVADGHSTDCRVGDHMSAGRLQTVGPDADADEVLDRMRREQVRRIPVVEGDRLIGIIAQADVAVDLGAGKQDDVQRTVKGISEPAEPNR